MKKLTSSQQRTRRHDRIRAKVFGTSEKPRLSVYRSNKFIYAQIIDDKNGKTLISASDIKMKKAGKMVRAEEVGKVIAKEAVSKKIKKVVFDRGGFLYAGRIKTLADSARKEGLEF